MPTYYEYAVTSTSGINISTIEDPLERDTATETNAQIKLYVPDRIVTASFRNSLSPRTTYYYLTEEEAEKLQFYDNVFGVERRNEEITFRDEVFEVGADGIVEQYDAQPQVRGATSSSFIPVYRTQTLNDDTISSSIGNPALILHSLPKDTPNLLEFQYNIVNNISSSATPGSGGGQLLTYTSNRTGIGVDTIVNDSFCNWSHADFYKGDGTFRLNNFPILRFLIEDLYPSLSEPYNSYYLVWVRKQLQYQLVDQNHGISCASTAVGEFHGNAKDSNYNHFVGTPSSAWGPALYDLIRHYHVSKSNDPYTGKKSPTVHSRSSGYFQKSMYLGSELLNCDGNLFNSGSGFVSTSFFGFDTGSLFNNGDQSGVRINYNGIDYFIFSASFSLPFNDYTIGSSPLTHQVSYINSNNPELWMGRLSDLDFIEGKIERNTDPPVCSVTSSEDLQWYMTVWTGSISELETPGQGGGHQVVILSGSMEDGTKPWWNVREWAPLGTPIGLASDGGTASKYAAPRAAYQCYAPNTDYHGVDNGWNLPVGDSRVREAAINSLTFSNTASAAVMAAQEEASRAGVVFFTAHGNTRFQKSYISCSTDDPFYRDKFNIEISVTNPIDGTTITGHPHNSYFVPEVTQENYRAGFRYYYNRNRDHHSLISLGNMQIISSSGTYYNNIISNTGNAVDVFMYGNYVRAAAYVNTPLVSKTGVVFTASYYNPSDDSYKINQNKSLLTDFTKTYNSVFNGNPTFDPPIKYPVDTTYTITAPITSSTGANPQDLTIESGSGSTLYSIYPGAFVDGALRYYSPQGTNTVDNVSTFPIERCTRQFGGTSAASPLLMGFIAGYLQENPEAEVNEVRDFIVSNSVDTLITTGSNYSASDHDYYDGYFMDVDIGTGKDFHWISGTIDATEEYGVLNYAPFTPTNQFLFPYTDISEQILKIKNTTLRST